MTSFKKLGIKPNLPKALGFGVILSFCMVEGFAVDISDLKKKAEKGDPKAQLDLGRAYMAGESIKRDTYEGVKWIMKSAEQKNRDAQFYLGVCYAYGFGVVENPRKAVDLLDETANPKNSDSVKIVWEAYEKLFKAGFFLGEGKEWATPDYTKAVEWTLLAAEKGIPRAQTTAAVLYYEGKGVPKDVGKAAKLMRAAAKNGDRVASQYADQFEYETMNPIQKWLVDRKKVRLAEENKKKFEEIQKKAKDREVADLLREIRDQNAELLEAVRESSEQSASHPNVVYVNDDSGDDLRREFKDSVDDLRNDIDRAAMWDAMQSRLRSE